MLFSCGAPPEPVLTPTPQTTSSVVPVAPTTTATAEAATDEPKDLPLPKTPDGADPELFRMAASICPVAAIQNPNVPTKRTVGCRVPPPFDTKDKRPDGGVATEVEDPLTFCAIDKVYRGSFTAPGAKQALIAFSQCKDDSGEWDAGNPGSVVVIEEAGDRWKVVAHQLGVDAPFCEMYKTHDKRDALACHSSYSAPPATGVRWFFSLDFGRSKTSRIERHAQMFHDDWGISCLEPFFMPDYVNYGIVQTEVKKLAVADTNKDGKMDLVIQMTRARAAPGKALVSKIEQLCKKKENVEPSDLLPKATSFTLDLLGDGIGFTPSSATQKTLDAWEKESPDHYAPW